MTRFVSPDLSRLPKMPLSVPDFEVTLAERMVQFKLEADAQGFAYDVDQLDSDPIKVDQIVGADREIGLYAEINDQTKANMLATSWGAYLDHIAATYYGIARLVVGRDPDTGINLMEPDDDFRARIQLAPEAFSTAGPAGAYAFHALELDGRQSIADAAVYGEEDGAVYMGGTLVQPAEVLVVILAHVTYEGSDADLIARTLKALSADDVRPVGDKVTVELATVPEYQIDALLRFSPGADAGLVIAEARANVEAYVAARRRIGAVVQRLGIGAAMKVADVTEIELIEPVNDIDPGSKGAAHCIAINIQAVEGEDPWRG